MRVYLQEAPKQGCGTYYKDFKYMFASFDKESFDLGFISYCPKCDIFDFMGKEFKSVNEAYSYLEENKNELVRKIYPCPF